MTKIITKDDALEIRLVSSDGDPETSLISSDDAGTVTITKKPICCYWRLGILEKNSDYVTWRDFETEEKARDAKESLESDSMVLFDHNRTAILFWCVHSVLDIAIILFAQQQQANDDEEEDLGSDGTFISTQIDRSQVETLVLEGSLPLVPTNRPMLQQWLLKRSMDLTFNRQTVRYFACGPLKYTSLYYYNVKKHPGVRGHVALTLDDAPCRFATKHNSRILDVASLLDKYDAKATFMVVGKFIPSHEKDLIDIVKRGNELGNHGLLDRPMMDDTPSDFSRDLEDCNSRIRSIQEKADCPSPDVVKWFRAPHGKYTKQMEEILKEHDMVNVMCDTYASDPIVQDGEYIGRSLARNCSDGSIILLHMPERGFRDWCWVALMRLLEGLKERNLKVVTVSELERLASLE